ncbi:hypothetical protein AAF712_013715 [Marasmius tenuissimus]|uniref:Uncharacterized protein n=1 Tax=Marasmius tenuissimus TaxID=585030 RepID=A0ABR2ZE93_9AGAR
MACHVSNGSELDCFILTSETQLLSTVGSTLYGFHTLLYVLCMYILFTRKQNRHWGQCALISAIYVAATVEFGLKYAIYSINSEITLDKLIMVLPERERYGATPMDALNPFRSSSVIQMDFTSRSLTVIAK